MYIVDDCYNTDVVRETCDISNAATMENFTLQQVTIEYFNDKYINIIPLTSRLYLMSIMTIMIKCTKNIVSMLIVDNISYFFFLVSLLSK